MPGQPRVSVVLPVRDAGATLDECLGSLWAQTFQEFEVLAIDDGSTDQGAARLQTAAAGAPRLRVLSQPRRGLVAALNAGLAQAQGLYLARMDADDLAHPRRLELQVRRLDEDSHTDILGSRVELIGTAGHGNEGMRAYVDWVNASLDHASIARELLVESPLVHPSVMMRRATLAGLGGYRAFAGPEDYDLWLRAQAAGLRFAKLPETLLAWRDRPERLTRTDPRYAPQAFLALKLEALRRRHPPPERGVVIWGAGRVGKSWARALAGAGYVVTAFIEVDRRKIGQRIYGVPVLDVNAAGSLRGPLHLGAVGGTEARERIRAEVARQGLMEGQDFVAVA